MTQYLGSLSTIALLAALGAPGLAMAQGYALEEITVTAERRTSTLQDTPIAVSVLTAAEIELANFSDSNSLAASVPNLQISSPWGASNPNIFMRGIGNPDVNATANSKVGIYQDQVFTGLLVGQTFQLFDLERIEALKGPQGTLYGKNTTGGAINIISRQPKVGDSDGYVTLDVGNYDYLSVEAAKTFTLSDKVSTRIAGVVNRRDGTAVNLVNGRHINDVDNYALRAMFHYEGENFDALLRLQRGRNRGDFRHGKPDTRRTPGGTSITGYKSASTDPDEVTTDLDTFLNVDQDGVALVMEWDLGNHAITSVTSYDEAKLRALQDADHSADSLIQIGWRTNSNLFAQELRLTSNHDGPFNYILGAFYTRERIGDGTGSDFYIFADVPPVPTNSLTIKQDMAQRSQAYAAFANFNYKFTEQFVLNGGLRYTIDRKNFWTMAELVNAGGFQLTDTFTVPYTPFKREWKKLSGNIGLEFHPNDDVMLYANYSRGFNGGGFNGGAIVDPGEATAFDPETLNAWEVGIKSSLFGRRATLNIAAFYYDYKDLQVQTITTSPFSNNFIQITENASNAEIYGSEIELSAMVTEHLRFNTAVGLLHTKYKDFRSIVGNATGNKLPMAPSVDISSSIHYQRPLGDDMGSIFLRGELSFQTRYYHNSAQRDDVSTGGSNETINLKVGWLSPSEQVRVTAWVNNLTDNRFVERSLDLLDGFGFISNWYNNPRTYGLQVSYQFN